MSILFVSQQKRPTFSQLGHKKRRAKDRNNHYFFATPNGATVLDSSSAAGIPIAPNSCS